VLTTRDEKEWESIFPCRHNVFGSVQFATIWQEQSGSEARLFVLESGQSTAAYPFFIRPIKSLSFAPEDLDQHWDLQTPDYSGPLASGSPDCSAAAEFNSRFPAYCQQQGIIAEFGHLHPWDSSTELLDESCMVFDRDIVYVDLSLSEDELWQASYTYSCRKNIRRAKHESVEVFEAEGPNDVREFHRIYVQTMDRVDAVDKYYFPLDFFMAFFEHLPDNARFALARREERVIAATLYLHDGDSVYSYLGGADHDFQQMRPTNAIVFDTILWAKRRGKRRLILGGGYRPDDGVFRFKASFSPLRARFHIYKRIHMHREYTALCAAWSEYYGVALGTDGFFPAYRALPPGIEEGRK